MNQINFTNEANVTISHLLLKTSTPLKINFTICSKQFFLLIFVWYEPSDYRHEIYDL